MSMRDFDKRWNDMQRRGDRIRRTAAVIMVLCWCALFGMTVAGAYLLFHPEVIGSFAGKIVAGYEGTLSTQDTPDMRATNKGDGQP